MAYHASVRRFAARAGTGLLLLTLALMASTGAQAAVLGPAVGANVPSAGQAPGSSAISALSPSTVAQVAQHAHASSLTNAPGVAAHVLRAPPTRPALGSVPAGIFSTPIQVSTTTTTDQNGGPVFAWSTNPSTVSDASGYVWTAWAANVSGRWSIFFAFSSSDGASFSSPVQLDSGATTQDTGPSLAVHGSGATAEIAVVWETRVADTVNPASSDGYVLKVSANGGSTWTQSGTNANWWGQANYGAMDTIESPTVAWTTSGYAEVAYWGYFVNYATYTTWPTGTVNTVDAYTGGTTICSGTGCPGAVFEGPRSTTALYWPAISFACSNINENCSFTYSVTNSAVTTDFVRVWYSFTAFLTLPYDAVQVTSAAMSSTTPYATVIVQQGETAYGGALGNDSAIDFLVNTGSTTSPTYDVAYYYNTATTYVRGAWPSGASTTTGLHSAYIALNPTTGAPFVSYVDGNSNVQATWTTSPTGTFLAPQLVAAGGALSATSVAMSTSSAPSPFRVDVAYVDAGNPASQIYYAAFYALYGTAAASPATVDLWQGVQFTATPGAGASPYTYSWNFGGACSPSCPTTTQSPLVNYTNPGTYSSSVQITDTIGEIITAAAGTVTVNPRLLVAVSPTSGSLDVNQSMTFTATPSGGSGSYSAYAWTVNGVAQSITGSSFTYTFATSGSIVVAVDVTDTLGVTSPWAGATISVALPLKVGLTSSSSSILPGNSVTFTATPTGGTTPYVYGWTPTPSGTFGCAAPTGATDVCTPTAAGTYMMMVSVTDSASPAVVRSAFTNVTVDTAMTVSATKFPSSPELGQTVFLNASVTGGTPSYTYQWIAGDGSATINGASATHVYASVGTYTAQVWVNDSLGFSVTTTVPVTVVAALSILSATGSPNPSNTTTMVTFSSAAAGGVTPYAYAWKFGDGGSGTTAWAHHNYTSASSYSVSLTVTDAAGHAASKTFTEVVNPPTGCGSSCQLVVTLTFSPSSPVAGLPVSFSASATGGTGGYAYAWTFGDGTNANTATGSDQHTYTTAGTYSAAVTVTSGSGRSGTAQVSVSVSPFAGIFTSSVTATPSTTDVGEIVSFDGSAIGGSGTYTSFSFSFGDGTPAVVVTTSPAVATHTFSSSGTYSVVLTVTDSTGAKAASAPTSVLVYPPITVALTATASGINVANGVDVNTNVIFSATVSGGSQSYFPTIWWTFGSGTSPQAGANQLLHAFAVAGTFDVRATANDTVGGYGTGSLNLTVFPAIAVVVTGNNVDSPAPVNMALTASLSGGDGTYKLLWTFGDGSPSVTTSASGSSATVNHNFTAAGGYEVQVIVTDSSGGKGTGFYNATVATASPNGSLFSTSIVGIPWWLLLVLVAVVVAAVIALLAMRRRRPLGEPQPDMEAFAPAPVLLATGASVNPDLMAPPVPAGASDQSPDDLGGVLPDAPAALPPGTRVSGAGAPLTPSVEPTVPPVSAQEMGPVLCPRCGSGLLGGGIPCPTCQYVSPEAPLETVLPSPVAEAVPSPAPAPSPIVGPAPSQLEALTHCPQCSGPLTPESECPVCQVRWEPSHPELNTTIGRPGMSGAAPPPPTAPLAAPTELTHCPQCGTLLAPGRVCPNCQVSWEPASSEPATFVDRDQGAEPLPPTSSFAQAPQAPPPEQVPAPAPVSEPPMVHEVPRTPAPPSPSVVERAEAPPVPPPEPSPPPAPKEVLPQAAPAESTASAAPAPSPPPAPSAAEPLTSGPGRCFICSGPLENGFCPRCNMSWADEGG